MRMILRWSPIIVTLISRNSTIGVLQISYRSTTIKPNFALFRMKNKSVSKYFECIQTDVMQINNQFCTISGNVTWWTSILARSRRSDLRIPCEILFNFNQINFFVSLRISKQLYCAFIYSRIQYSIKAYAALKRSTHPYGSCAQRALIIEIDDVHIAKVLF